MNKEQIKARVDHVFNECNLHEEFVKACIEEHYEREFGDGNK